MIKPYIKIGHVVLEAISFILIIGSIIFSIIWMQSIEGEIPTHFSMSGEIDGYGSPATVLFMPICMLLVNLSMALSAHLIPPKGMNFPFVIKPGREIKVLSDNMWMIVTLELIMAVYNLVFTIQLAYTLSGMLAASIILMVIIFADIIFWVVKEFKDNK